MTDLEQFSLLHEAVARDRGDLIVVFCDLGFLSEMHRIRVTDRQSAYFDMSSNIAIMLCFLQYVELITFKIPISKVLSLTNTNFFEKIDYLRT